MQEANRERGRGIDGESAGGYDGVTGAVARDQRDGGGRRRDARPGIDGLGVISYERRDGVESVTRDGNESRDGVEENIGGGRIETIISGSRTRTRHGSVSRLGEAVRNGGPSVHVRKPYSLVGRQTDDRSSFRCVAPCQKYRNFSMYFILNHLAGYSCVAFMGVNILFQLVMIVIGLVFLNQCPMVGQLPVWNICAGLSFSLKMFTAMMFLAVIRKDVRLTGGVPEKTTIYKSPRYFCLFGIVDCLLVALLILGMTLTMPHIECMTQRLSEKPPTSCGSEETCHYLVYFFSVAAMIFLETVYAVGYMLGLWISGCFYTVGVAEEAAGKVVKGFSKLRNRSSWSMKSDEQKMQKRKARKNKDGKQIKKKKRKGERQKPRQMRKSAKSRR